MNRYNKTILTLLAVGVLGITGCGEDAEYTAVKNIESVVSENTGADYVSMTEDEKEALIYKATVKNSIIDLDSLSAVTEEDSKELKQYLSSIKGQIEGKISIGDRDRYFLSDKLISYICSLQERTPYIWGITDIAVTGVDNNTGSIVVDMTMNTTNKKKAVRKAGKVAIGNPEYTSYVSGRYNNWIACLNGAGSYSDGVTMTKGEFIRTYGDIKDLLVEQSTDSLAKQRSNGVGQFTYMCETEGYIDSGATMRFRFILEPTVSLGIRTGFTCEHAYLLDYKLDKEYSGNKEYKQEGIEALVNKVDRKVYSYLNCLDEHNFSGLYTLMLNFNKYDRFYKDIFDTTYSKNSSYVLNIVGIEERTIKCLVDVTEKERGIGTNMTYPIYAQSYYMELKFDGEDLSISRVQLLESHIVSEPTVKEKSYEDGFDAVEEFTEEDKKGIGECLSKFATVQLKGEYAGADFFDCVDSTMATNDITVIKERMGSITATKKTLWVKNYTSGFNGHATVKCKEVFVKADNTVLESNTQYELIHTQSGWVVESYAIISTSTLNKKGKVDKNGSLFTADKESLQIEQEVEDDDNN